MDEFAEIDDPAVRDAIDVLQGLVNFMILDLLSEDRGEALAQIEAARNHALNYAKNLGSEFLPMDREAKGGRITVRLLERQFRLLRRTIELSDDDDGPLGEQGQ